MLVDGGGDFMNAVMYLQVLYIASLTEQIAVSLSKWTQCPWSKKKNKSFSPASQTD